MKAKEIAESISLKMRAAPAQKASSSERNWFAKATRVPTRSSRARVMALKALVSSESGAMALKRWWSVRASSARQKASKGSLLARDPAALNGAREALNWLGGPGLAASPNQLKASRARFRAAG